MRPLSTLHPHFIFISSRLVPGCLRSRLRVDLTFPFLGSLTPGISFFKCKIVYILQIAAAEPGIRSTVLSQRLAITL